MSTEKEMTSLPRTAVAVLCVSLSVTHTHTHSLTHTYRALNTLPMKPKAYSLDATKLSLQLRSTV